tara:strand:+ start:4070 stop:4252 length:183 start_codon:yes stop_codon:yes gene_type:complete
MSSETFDIIVNKMFDFFDYIYERLYESNVREGIIIELGNLYTIYEGVEEEEELMEEFILI